jgi:hypothetical protein
MIRWARPMAQCPSTGKPCDFELFRGPCYTIPRRNKLLNLTVECMALVYSVEYVSCWKYR